MSSISSTRRPIRNGFRYWSTAVCTTRARWVNVAQPRPYEAGLIGHHLHHDQPDPVRRGEDRLDVLDPDRRQPARRRRHRRRGRAPAASLRPGAEPQPGSRGTPARLGHPSQHRRVVSWTPISGNTGLGRSRSRPEDRGPAEAAPRSRRSPRSPSREPAEPLLELVAEAELHLTRRVRQRGHAAEVGTGDASIPGAPDRPVEQVEHLEPELEAWSGRCRTSAPARCSR